MTNNRTGKRLAKNTLFMYFRMAFLTIISLYTSRVILQKLGVEDYGIYNVVGSIVLMFNSLKSIFASSTQRFLNVEMGKGNNERLQLIYNMSTVINLLIALLIVLLVECVGLWFLNYKINVAQDRVLAAGFVLQFSIAATVVGLMNVPLHASIIAHERMDFYAYSSIFEGLAKLGICYMLTWGDFDRLIVYSLLILIVHVIIYLVNFIFCRLHFEECKFARVWDKVYFTKMTTFAGWAFFGNTSYALTQSGMNLVLNVFGGPIVNAARGIAHQVTTALHGFISNIVIVIKPYAVKTYASGQREKTMDLVFISSKIYFLLQLCILVIFSFMTEYILNLWLGQVPEYSALFLNLVLVHSVVKALHSPIDMLFSAEGNIKYYQIVEGIILAMPIPASYIMLYLGLPYYSAFLSIIVFEVFHIAAIAFLASRICHLDLKKYNGKVILHVVMCFVIYAVCYSIKVTQFTTVIASIAFSLFTIVMIVLYMAFNGFDSNERRLFVNIVKKR